MADDDLDFADRFAEVPVDPVDAESEAKKLELLKLQQALQMPVPDLVMPKSAGPSDVDKEIMRSRGADMLKAQMPQQAAPPPPPMPPEPPEPSLDQLRLAGIEGLKAGFEHAAKTGQPLHNIPDPEAQADISKLSTAPVRPEGFTPEESPARDLSVRQAGANLKKFKGFSPEVEQAIVKA